MPAYHLLYPMLDIEFLGRLVYLRGPYPSKYVVKIGKRGREKYLAVNCKAVPKNIIAGYNVDMGDALRAVTTYISNHLKEKFARGKGFFDRSKPVYQTVVTIIKSRSTLNIYKGFIAEYYLADPQSIRRLKVSIVPAFEFELTKPLAKIIWENIKDGIPRDILVDELGDVDLNTVEEYWKRNIGPKYAGEFVDICLRGDPEHREKILAIEKYYSEKKKLGDIRELNPNYRNDIIITTEKTWNGEKKRLDYLGSLTVLTPNMEVLSAFLDERELSNIHNKVRPRNHSDLKKLLVEAVRMYVENLPELVEVRENAMG